MKAISKENGLRYILVISFPSYHHQRDVRVNAMSINIQTQSYRMLRFVMAI